MEQLFTRKQTAEIFQVKPRTIILWEKKNIIKRVFDVNGRPRYHIDDIAKVASLKQKPVAHELL